jgi:hypothetical protein
MEHAVGIEPVQAKKSATGKSRRQGLEIFSVNEKVCFGKQQLKYNGTPSGDHQQFWQSTIAVPSTIDI